MKIVNIVPGFGGTFYCGNCLRDSAYSRVLRETGHETITLPVYLPLSLDGEVQKTDIPIFYGAVNVYLKQEFPVLRNMPQWLERAFNAPWILKLAAAKAGSTRSEGLEPMTESMLLGMEGNQASELRHLVDYLKFTEKPDIVHFSNALLLGMAGQIRNEAGIPVVCSLQDEDVWIDAMRPAYREKMWALLAEKAKDVDAFVAVSSYFGTYMQLKLNIPSEKLHIIPIGVIPDQYPVHLPATNPPAIGYLSRINEENGFGILAEAFIKLKKEPQFATLKLIACGGKTADDNHFLKQQLKKFRSAGIHEDVEIIGGYTRAETLAFFKRISLLSVPVLKGEAFGMYLLESMASGIPVIQPSLGAFPEIVHETQGGVIFSPNTPDALAQTLAKVIPDREKILAMSHSGRMAIEKTYDCRKLTAQMLKVYQKITSNHAFPA